jgi:cell division cycle 14
MPGAAAAPRHEILRLLATGQSELDENGELCVIQGRLYLASLAGLPVPTAKTYFITLKKMRYIPFCADFGPFNLGTLHHICQALVKTVLNPKLQDFRVVYYTSQDPRDVTNSIYLLGAFLCLHLGATPEEAWGPFQSLKDTSNSPMCLPYRDATWVKSSYDLHVKEYWAGLVRAVATGLYDLQAFDKHEYFYYDDPEKGDLHMVVPGKFLAFRGPRDATDHRGSLPPSAYIKIFKMLKVSTIVRLNEAEYSRETFKAAGFEHVDQVFEDCSVPPSNIVDSFLLLAEGLKPGAVMAVHCLAGLGRTGTLIALYMMKHFGFTANEAMGWIRICRPGSIIGPQQQFLADQEERMHRLGTEGVPGLGNQLGSTFSSRTTSPSNYRNNDGITQSKVLAEMVTDGMLNRTHFMSSMRSPQASSASLFHAEVVASMRREEQELAEARAQREACATECVQLREQLRWLEEELAVRTAVVAAHEERVAAAENVLQARNALENMLQVQSSKQGQEQGQVATRDPPQSDQTNTFFHRCRTFLLQAPSCKQGQEQAAFTRNPSASAPEELPPSAATNTFLLRTPTF